MSPRSRILTSRPICPSFVELAFPCAKHPTGASFFQQLRRMPRGTRSWPLLREAARFVGYADTRRRGTVCGSLAFAASWGELTAAAVARDAVIEVRAARGERPIAARSFFRGAN